MTIAPYYTGDNVPLRFKITDTAGDVNPTSAEVYIRVPNNQVVGPYTAQVEGNEVSYALLDTDTGLAGNYSVYFTITLPGGLKRTHKVECSVIKSP